MMPLLLREFEVDANISTAQVTTSDNRSKSSRVLQQDLAAGSTTGTSASRCASRVQNVALAQKAVHLGVSGSVQRFVKIHSIQQR